MTDYINKELAKDKTASLRLSAGKGSGKVFLVSSDSSHPPHLTITPAVTPDQ